MRTSFIILFCLSGYLSNCQIQWSVGKTDRKDISWDNYSTSFIDPESPATPIIVTAIPYNGNYSNFTDISAAMDMTFDSSLYRFRSNLAEKGRQLYTYDSSEVYFLVPGIYATNAAQYEYRVLLNGKTVILPWSNITNFTDSDFVLNESKKGMAFLGGYKTNWDNYLTIELKKKQGDTIIANSLVYWKQVKPGLLNIYTTDELNSFLARLKKPYDFSVSKGELNKWKLQYKPAEINPANGLP